MKIRTGILATVVMILSMQADAIEVNKQSCLNAITSLELPSEPYEFKDGWLGEKHIFGETVECSEKHDQLFITQGRTTLVEDGFFGSSALAARDKALAVQRKEDGELKEERDKLVASAKESYKASLAILNSETQQQLQQIREGGVPDSIAIAIEAEQLDRKEAKEKAIAQKAKKEVKKTELRIEREAKREAEREQKEKQRNAALKAERSKKLNCRQELDCWGDKASTYASVLCPKHIERLAKNEHEWTDGFLGAKFTEYRWSDKEAGVVTLIGDSLKFQNGFGAMVNVVYECDIDPEPGEVINVRVSEGKL